MDEARRIQSLYRRRDLLGADHWSPRSLRAQYYRHCVERALIDALNRTNIALDGADILDVGCGSAPQIRFFSELGAERERLHGIDLSTERIEQARILTPNVDLRVGDAMHLPWPDESFDLVAQFTALCNIKPDPRRRAAAEILRVLRPKGAVLSFDIAADPSGTAPYFPIPRDEIEGLFPELQMVYAKAMFHRWTAMFGQRIPEAADLLERLPLPKTNLLAVLR